MGGNFISAPVFHSVTLSQDTRRFDVVVSFDGGDAEGFHLETGDSYSLVLVASKRGGEDAVLWSGPVSTGGGVYKIDFVFKSTAPSVLSAYVEGPSASSVKVAYSGRIAYTDDRYLAYIVDSPEVIIERCSLEAGFSAVYAEGDSSSTRVIIRDSTLSIDGAQSGEHTVKSGDALFVESNVRKVVRS